MITDKENALTAGGGRFMKARKIFVITISLVSSILSVGCSRNQTKKSHEKPVKKEVVMRIQDKIKTLDTTKSLDSNSLVTDQNVFEGLYRYDKKGHLVLAGAKSEKTENGGKVHVYELRKDAKWSNGNPVVAQDYVYAWKKLLSPENDTSNWANLLILKNAEEIHEGKKDLSSLGVQALDDHTLKVEFRANVPYYKEILAISATYPQNHAIAEKYGNDYGKTSESTVFNGPFTVKGLESGSLKWELIKNKNYWGKKDVKLNRLSYVVDKNKERAQKNFFKGRYDYARIGCFYDKKLASKSGFHYHRIPEISIICFNPKRQATGNVHFRRAVTYAIDREKIAATKGFHGQALYGIVPADYSYNPENDVDYREDAGRIVDLNKAKAKSEWEQAKKEIGKNQVELTLTLNDNRDYLKIAKIIKKNLETILPGLHIRLNSVAVNDKLTQAIDYDYDMYYRTWQPRYIDPMAFAVNGGIEHLKKDYNNPDYWNNIEKALITNANKFSRRRQCLIAAEKDLIEKDAFVAPICQQENGYLLNPKLHGLVFVPYSTNYILRNCWIEK